MSRPTEFFVSTGHLPASTQVQALVDQAWREGRAETGGACSTVYPALARVDPDQLGVCLVGTSGRVWSAGDADPRFAIMSVSKPFVFALVCEALGAERARELLGVNATGHPFDSAAAIDLGPDGRTNPMVNAGALATTSLVPGSSQEDRWTHLLKGLSRFAGRTLTVDAEVLASARETNHRNAGLAWLLHAKRRLGTHPEETVDLYTRQCALSVSARDLAIMGATLADGGVNPVTRERVISARVCHHVLAVMATAGLYEASGDWLYSVGVPGKSGIGGGIVTVIPGKGGLGTWSPRLDSAGNSVAGQKVAQVLTRRLGLSIFASVPAGDEADDADEAGDGSPSQPDA